MNTQLRLVAIGRMSATQDEIICDPSFQDTWHEGLSNSIDGLLTDAQIEAEWVELTEAMSDEDFWRLGC